MIEKDSMNARGYSIYFMIGLVTSLTIPASKKVAGKASSEHTATGFHHSTMVKECNPMEKPKATIMTRLKMNIRIISLVRLFKPFETIILIQNY